MATLTDSKVLFKDCWNEEIEKRQEQSPSFTPDQYVATGRASAEYGGKRNEKWWLDNGPDMIDRWVAWREKNQWTIWDVDGVPAIEMECRFTLPGDIYVLAFIDRVFVTPTGEIVVVDLKTGRSPETPEQLGLYATAINVHNPNRR